MKLSRLTVSLCFVAISGAANAQQRDTMILSEGMSTCGEYIAEPAKQGIRVAWVLGYISGANSHGPAVEATAGAQFSDAFHGRWVAPKLLLVSRP